MSTWGGTVELSASTDRIEGQTLALMEAARTAGVKRWWGDGPRPLNHPASDPTTVNYRTPAYWRRVGDHSMLITPILLEPTQAQLERGVRVLYIEHTSQRTATAIRAWALAHGWDARLSRSRYLSAPTNAGAAERRGRRLEVETLRLRLRREPVDGAGGIAAALGWEFDIEQAKWKVSGGVVGDITVGGVANVRSVGIDAMQVIMGMKIEIPAGEAIAIVSNYPGSCPRCMAGFGFPCFNGRGILDAPHKSRVDVAREWRSKIEKGEDR